MGSPATAPIPSTNASSPVPLQRKAFFDTAIVFGVALVARLAALPFTTIDSADSATRIWLGWQWIEQPFLITSGIWGPLHFYLIGAALSIWPDPVWTPIALHVLLGSIIPIIVYLITLELFRDWRPALLAGLAFAAYPVAVADSLRAISETPFCVFFALALLFLVRARTRGSGLWNPVIAGIALTLAGMLRYEAWLLMPAMTLILLDRPRQAAVFLTCGLIHPVFWMTGNFLAYGDPLYSFTWSSIWQHDAMGNGVEVTFASVVASMWDLVYTTERGLSPPISALLTVGVISCLWQRRRECLWLVPPLSLFLVFMAAASSGSFGLKWQYTITFGLLLIPFIGFAYYALGANRWHANRQVGALGGLLVLIAISTIEPLWQRIPHGEVFLARAAPGFPGESEAADLIALVDQGRTGAHDALLTDFYGWLPTHYVAWQTRLHPSKICAAPGAPGEALNAVVFKEFLETHPSGVLVTYEQGRLTSLLERQSNDVVRLDDLELRVNRLGAVAFPAARTEPAGLVEVSQYTVTASGSTGEPAADIDPCRAKCTVNFCTAD